MTMTYRIYTTAHQQIGGIVKAILGSADWEVPRDYGKDTDKIGQMITAQLTCLRHLPAQKAHPIPE